jgi:hypothetical protein
MNDDRKKLLDKILKLFALASNASSYAGEAANAKTAAEMLMAKHNISLGEKEDRNALKIEHYTPWAKGAQWEFDIVAALTKLCGCAIYFYGDFERYVLVGRVTDLEGLRYLIGAISNQRIAAWLNYKRRRDGSDNLWAFCYAFAQALQSKIDALLVGATEIAAAREKARLWFESTHPINKNSDHDWITGRASSAAGGQAGANASLARGAIGQPIYRIAHRK